MLPTMRPCKCDIDYMRIRAFLRNIYLEQGRSARSWQVARLDYWRWHVVANCGACDPPEKVTYLWECDKGQLAAVLHPEGRGEAHLDICPHHRTEDLEREMIAVAERRLSVAADGSSSLIVFASEDDDVRPRLLDQMGYARQTWAESAYRRDLTAGLPSVGLFQGYRVRSLGSNELPARSLLSWHAFHPNEPIADYEGWHWYENIQQMPLYRQDLDLVAVAPDGQLAAFCTVWYDDVTHTAMFEPVGTHPAHQRRGLASAVILEGMRRAKGLGATLSTVGGYSAAANALYTKLFGPAYDQIVPWKRIWSDQP